MAGAFHKLAVYLGLVADDRYAGGDHKGGPIDPNRSLSHDEDKTQEAAIVAKRKVMVIYGHDDEANRALFNWLRAIGLEPLEWGQLVKLSGEGSPYIGKVLEQAFQHAQAVVAFFTPDEHAAGRGVSPANKGAWRLQARPNVLIEAGMALVTHPRRTVFVLLGDQELPSDLAGRHYIQLNNTSGPLYELANRLAEAGCDLNRTGTQWLDPANFPSRSNLQPAPPQRTNSAARSRSAAQP
jgi:predicted nucleotide-binding protein